MEILISVLAGVGALAILVTAYVVYRWVRITNQKIDGHDHYFEMVDERMDNVYERFRKVHDLLEDLDGRVDGLEGLMSDQIMDKIKKK